jgi:type VI secretion system protein ImpA
MPLRDDLLNPIPGANPCGENLRYAPVYDQIKEARREEADIAQGDWQTAVKKADWPLVIKLSGEVLAKKSKDLQLAAWLTEALLRREGFSGLSAGLGLMRALLDNFWEGLYPEIEDGDTEMRAMPLDWLGSRLDEAVKSVPITRSGYDWIRYKESRSVPYEADCEGSEAKRQTRDTAIEDHKLTPEEFDTAFDGTPKATYQSWMDELDQCLQGADALQQACEEKFTDAAPNLGGLKKSLEEVKQSVHVLLAKKRQQESDQGSGGAAAEEAVEESSGYSEEPAEAAAAPARAKAPAAKRTLAAEPADAQDAYARVAAAARFLRQNDSSSPVPFLLLRGMRWGELRAVGPGYDPDSSLMEAPPTETRTELKRLASDGDWAGVLELGETAMGEPCGRAWLDLQRYAATACENLGYTAAAAAIIGEVKALLADYPTLPEMSMLDDTPTANAETRKWLEDYCKPAAAAPAGDYYRAREPEPAQETEPGEEAPPDAYQMALDAARAGRPKDAIEIMAREAAQESSGRARFERRTQLAQICLGANHAAVAHAILQELAEEIDKRRLEEWEGGEMIAHTLGLLYRSMNKVEVPQEEKQRVYSRICRLDPVQALAIAK